MRYALIAVFLSGCMHQADIKTYYKPVNYGYCFKGHRPI